MAERVHGIRLRVYEYRTLVCPMPPREASDARKTPVPVLIDSSLKQRERERERKEDGRSLSFSLFSSHFESRAPICTFLGPRAPIVWRTFRERRRESRACVGIIAMPIRSTVYVARKFNAPSRPCNLTLLVA